MEERNYKIYMYTNKINGKKYIGQTSQTLKRRAGSNFVGYKSSPIFYEAIKKNPNDFESIILLENLTHEEANIKEEELIKKYNLQDENFGYNIQPGGSSFIMNEKIKKKIGECTKNSKKFQKNNFEAHAKSVVGLDIESRTFKVYLSATDAANDIKTSRGNISSMCRGEGRAISLKGKIWFFEKDFDENLVDEYIQNYQKRNSNKYSEERNKKIGESKKKKYKENPKMYAYNEKKVQCIETGEVFDSLTKAAKAKNIKAPSNIRNAANGKRQTAAGLHWKFI